MKKINKIAIVGYDQTQFGDLYEYGIADMANLAIMGALKEGGVKPNDIDSLYVGNAGSGQFLGQEHLGALISTESGLNVQSVSVEAFGASGATAMRMAAHGIFSGYVEKAVVIGIEKMTSFSKSEYTQSALASSLDTVWESSQGATLSGNFALMAKSHMQKFGTTKEQMAMVAVKNHANGKLNPRAQFKNNLKVESIMNSKMLADPITIFSGCAPSDGAAALIMMAPDIAESYDSEPIYVNTISQGHDYLPIHQRDNLYELKSTRDAANKAYKQINIKAADIDFAEIHDVFTIAEIMAIEALGLVEIGKGGIATENGDTSLTGRIPINTSGGLKARGYPIGASGIAQVIEVIEQFKGKAGKRQLKDINYGLTQSLGGTGATSVVSIFSR